VTRISGYAAVTSAQPDDLLAVVDVHDTTMAASGTTKKVTLGALYGATAPWQFTPEAYGAKGDGKLISDGATTSGSNILAAAGITAPSAPGLAHAGSGGTILAGTYQVRVTYVNTYGESLPSSSASTTTTGSASTITITAPVQTADATGWYAYVTQAGGSTWTRQQAAGSPAQIGSNLVLTAPPSAGGAAPPASNTTPSSPFTAADAGKAVWVPATWQLGTITGFTDSSHVTLSFNAGASLSMTGVAYGTDDTAAVQAAINAAAALSVTGSGTPGEVLFGGKIYVIAGPAVTGGVTGGNSQLTLPYVSQEGGSSSELYLTGAGLQPFGWVTQEVPAQGGTILLSLRNDAAVDGTYGYPFVIGGNFDTNNWSNMTVTVDKIAVVVAAYNANTPPPAVYGGLGLNGVLGANIKTFAYMPLAIEAHGYANPSQTWPNVDGSLGNTGGIPTTSIGLQMPAFNNQGFNLIGWYSCEWAGLALAGTEHISVVNFFCQYCSSGWAPSQGHGQSILEWSCQRVPNAIDVSTFTLGAQAPVFVGMLSLETWNVIANDPSALVTGTVSFQTSSASGTNYGSLISAGTNVPGLKLISADTKPGPVTAPSVPASGTALGNFFYRDATVHITGTMTGAVKIDGTSTGSSAAGPYRVPSGHSITLTYSSAPTWAWVLD
jgi:hypothetical protein